MFHRALIVTTVVGLLFGNMFAQEKEKTDNESKSEPQIGLRLGPEFRIGILGTQIGVIRSAKNFPEFMRFVPIHEEDKSKVPAENNGPIPDDEIWIEDNDFSSLKFSLGLTCQLDLHPRWLKQDRYLILNFKGMTVFSLAPRGLYPESESIRERNYMSDPPGSSERLEIVRPIIPSWSGFDNETVKRIYEEWFEKNALTYYGAYCKTRPFYFNMELGFGKGSMEDGTAYILGYSETPAELILEQGWERMFIIEPELEPYKTFTLEKFRQRKFYLGAYLYSLPKKGGLGIKLFLNAGFDQASQRKTINKVSVSYGKIPLFCQFGIILYPSVSLH